MFTFRRRYVLMTRRDGLGERLCAMMNAIRIASALGHRFRFLWEDDVWNSVYHELTTEAQHKVLGQSIAPVRQFFSPAFIRDFHLDQMPGGETVLPFPPKKCKIRKIRKLERAKGVVGWDPNQHRFSPQTEEFLNAARALSYPQAFQKIGFAPAIQTAIDSALGLDIGPFVALHLRSGDMVFGEVRKWGHWENKVLNPFVAGDIIEEAKRENKSVVLFGQDVPTLEYLKKKHGCQLAVELGTYVPPAEQSMFEIMLMSRAETIVSGNSGFSRAASMIGGKPIQSMFALRDRDTYSKVTLELLEKADGGIHSKMIAYSYWQTFVFSGRNMPEDSILQALEKAEEHDLENLLYPIVRASRLYRNGKDKEAEAVLSAVRDRIDAGPLHQDHPLIQQLNFKYYSTPPTHVRQFDDFVEAAERPGNALAAALVSHLENTPLVA